MNRNINEKTALVVDGNWLLMGRQFMLREKFLLTNPESTRTHATEELAELMLQSISVCLRTFGDIITNVIFVADGRSWRKQIEKPEIISDTIYKGTRSSASDIDWDAVWKSMSLLEGWLSVFGVTVSVSYGVEGDDWCWWWSRKMNAQGTNVILWTIDEDVKQLVRQDPETFAWTAWYEKRPGLVLNESMSSDIDNMDDDMEFFMTPISQAQSPLIDSIKKKVKVSYVNPKYIINKKIYVGDNGDNILPAFTYMKNGKVYKATEKDMSAVIDMNESDYNDTEWEYELGMVYDDIYKYKGNKLRGADVISKKDFIEHALYNRTMVWLDDSRIPSAIQESMSRVEYKELSPDAMHDMMYDWKAVKRGKDMDLQSLLDGEDLPF